MAGRRTSLASLAGAKVDTVPGQSDPLLLALPLDTMVPTRFNPRRNFGTDEALREFGQILTRRQLQPAVVVSRAAYLKLWPDEANNVGSAPYVVANGERRLRASRAVGRTTLDVVHNEGVAESKATFLDAVLSENNDREDLDPIERAFGIETMVTELGGADAVAAHYGKTKGWVSQQRKLLKLAPQMQALVSAGELPVRVARDIAGLPADEQAGAWAAEQRQREEAKAMPRAARIPAPPAEKAPRFTAVNQQQETDGGAERFTAVNQSSTSAPAASGGVDQLEVEQPTEAAPVLSLPAPALAAVPDPRPEPEPEPEQQQAKAPTRMPWADGRAAMDIMVEHMIIGERPRALARYVELVGGPDAFAADLAAGVDPDDLRGLIDALRKHLDP